MTYCPSQLAIAPKQELSASLDPRPNSPAWCGSFPEVICTGIVWVWDRELIYT